MVDKADRLKRAVTVLVRLYPVLCLIKDILIDIDKVLGLGEAF